MPCSNQTITITLLDNLATNHYVGDLQVSVTGTTVEGFYTLNGVEYPINSGTTINTHDFITANINVHLLIDGCVYDCNKVVTPQLNPDGSLSAPPIWNYIETYACSLSGETQVLGCTNPSYDNYNPLANWDDGSCNISGCTNPLAINYNSGATVDDGSCQFIISGCTDPLSVTYNPSANVDDGSCEYEIIGCTNPLSSNYNPNATMNDGSCVFTSGCTNPVAQNYNELAVIDDGSCKCSSVDMEFVINGENQQELEINCDYIVQFDSRIKVDCSDLIDYFEFYTQDTMLGILTGLTMNFETFSGDTLTSSSNIWGFDITGNPTGLVLNGDCDIVLALLGTELGTCDALDISRFRDIWLSHTIKIPSDLAGTFRFNLNLTGFGFKFCLDIDNVKLTKVCDTINTECVVIPYSYGFDLQLEKDNRKSYVGLNDYLLNTKYLELSVNPTKIIYSDVQAWLQSQMMSFDWQNATQLELNQLYNCYLNDNFCNPSKKLDYDFVFNMIETIDFTKLEPINNFVNATVVWDGILLEYKNNVFDNLSFDYPYYNFISSTLDNQNCNCLEQRFDYYVKIDQIIDPTGQSTVVLGFVWNTFNNVAFVDWSIDYDDTYTGTTEITPIDIIDNSGSDGYSGDTNVSVLYDDPYSGVIPLRLNVTIRVKDCEYYYSKTFTIGDGLDIFYEFKTLQPSQVLGCETSGITVDCQLIAEGCDPTYQSFLEVVPNRYELIYSNIQEETFIQEGLQTGGGLTQFNCPTCSKP